MRKQRQKIVLIEPLCLQSLHKRKRAAVNISTKRQTQISQKHENLKHQKLPVSPRFGSTMT